MPIACLPAFASPSSLRPAHRALVASALLGACVAAGAADFSVGGGGGADRGHVDCVASFPCDRGDKSFKLFAGYQITPVIDLRVMVFDAGRFKGGDPIPPGTATSDSATRAQALGQAVRNGEAPAPTPGTTATEFGGDFKVRGIGITAGYRWDLAPAWSLTGRAGIASVRTRFDYANSVWGSVSKSKVEPMVGLGVGYDITPAIRIGLDYDATRFKVYRTQGFLQMLGLAAQFSF